MKPAPVGTIFASSTELKKADAHADKLSREKEHYGDRVLGEKYDKRVVHGEVRYYDGENRYAIVSSKGNNRILWFRKREGKWFAS